MRCAQHVRAFGHEVNAAENDVVSLRPIGNLSRKTERVAGVVGETDDLVALVWVTKDHEPVAERASRIRDTYVHLVIGETEVLLGKRLPFRQVLLLVLG